MQLRGTLSPLDGRYSDSVTPITKIFSERALMKQRVLIEVQYLIKLINDIPIAATQSTMLVIYEAAMSDVDLVDRIFEIEKTTKHDVKAVELAIREYLLSKVSIETEPNLRQISAMIHFALTSQDINSLATTIQVGKANKEVISPTIRTLVNTLYERSRQYHGITMLSHTHGQPATPTTLGHQFGIFAERLDVTIRTLVNRIRSTKFGGATGGFNAHHFVYPNIDWKGFADEFLAQFFLDRQQYTKQIEHYDGLSDTFDNMKRLATILVDLCSDIWHYIHLGYLKQRADAESVGSSTMPHKINPIQFENAEGNLQLSIALFEFMSRKLPVSRLQRDLTDSTVIRNIGVAYGHFYLGLSNVCSGLNTIDADETAIAKDLNAHPEVITEGLQCLLRSDGFDTAYDDFHLFSRQNSAASIEQIREFVKSKYSSSQNLDVMMELSPGDYRPI